jgi:hypothetical protein
VGRKAPNKRGTDELSRPEKRSIGNRPPLTRPVDAIAEDEEEPSFPPVSPTSGIVPFTNQSTRRADTSQFDTTGRTRTISTSQIQTGTSQNLFRKNSSFSAKASIPVSQKRSAPGPNPLELSDRPNRTRKVQRDIIDMDLGAIMNGSDDEKADSRTLSSFKTPRHPKISKTARDLIDFLDEGPPVDFAPPPPQSPAASSLRSRGRFQRMMSKLTGSPSNERLREDGAKLRKGGVTNSAFNNTNPPQTPIKRVPTVVVATPPPRLQPAAQQVTPPNSPPAVNQDPLRPVQRRTSVRKKVPPLDPELETSKLGPPSTSASLAASSERRRSSTITNGSGQPNGVNEARKLPSPPSSSPELESRTRGSPDTITSDEKIVFRRPTPTPPTKVVDEAVAPAPLPVTIRPPSPLQRTELSLDAIHAQNLRQLMSTATTADECRVLVDMFLARVGFPVDRSTNADPYPSPVSSTDPSDVELEGSVIETLLGGGSPGDPSTTTHSVQQSEAGQVDVSEVGTSDAETCDDNPDLRIQHSASRIARGAHVNHPLPPTTRLLAVA